MQADYVTLEHGGSPVSIYMQNGQYMVQPLGESPRMIDADEARNLLRAECQPLMVEIQAVIDQDMPPGYLKSKFDKMAVIGRLLTGEGTVITETAPKARPAVVSAPKPQPVQQAPAADVGFSLEGAKVRVVGGRTGAKSGKRKVAAG